MYLSEIVVDGFRAASKGPLHCYLPGRFSVLVGANSTGKSTVSDSIAIAHTDVFPWKPRSSSAALTREGRRTIDVTYDYEEAETLRIWDQRRAQGIPPPTWTRRLRSSMGVVRSDVDAAPEAREVFANLPVMYLPSTRNPVEDLAGRDARLIVEMLRSEAKRLDSSASLAGLRKHLGNLMNTIISNNSLLTNAEARVDGYLNGLTTGVSKRSAFLATTDVDDLFLARVFEFFVGSQGQDRDERRTYAHRLELEGLGYANLLQLAVVLAAIPDLTAPEFAADDDSVGNQRSDVDEEAPSEGDGRSASERESEIDQADTVAEAAEDSFFKDQFHACVILEEPEAHLHPQLQHGLVRYLRSVISERPEIQIILTTHSDEIVAACDPEDLVVFRREGPSQPMTRTVKRLRLPASYIDLARRHLDVSRSASLFAERIVLVEGITDAQLLRAFGVVWCDGDVGRTRFLDALTIAVLGSRVGPWLPRLLATPSQEIATRVAVLMDSDGKPKPKWAAKREGTTFMAFLSQPTLEPSIYAANDTLCLEILEDLGFEQDENPDDLDACTAEVAEWFKAEGRRTKAKFADELAEVVESAPSEATLPEHFRSLLDFVYEGHEAAMAGTAAAPLTNVQ